MYLYGASGHAKVIIDILASIKIEVQGFFDDNPALKELKRIPVFHQLPEKTEDLPMIISIGNNHIRQKLASTIIADYGTAVHNTATLSPSVHIGAGTVVMNGVNINSDTQIGKHAIINTASSIDHDCQVGDFCHISPKATLCGGITVGDGTQIGAGAVVIPNINIGRWAVIGAGAVIVKDIPDYAVVVGNPGKIIKYTNE